MFHVKTDRKYMSRRDVVEQDVHVREINSSRISLSSPFVFPRFAAKRTLYIHTHRSQYMYHALLCPLRDPSCLDNCGKS